MQENLEIFRNLNKGVGHVEFLGDIEKDFARKLETDLAKGSNNRLLSSSRASYTKLPQIAVRARFLGHRNRQDLS